MGNETNKKANLKCRVHLTEQLASVEQNIDQAVHDCILQYTSKGLRYSHIRINSNTSKVLECASFLYALIDLLSEKSIITIEELDGRKKQVAERLVQKFAESGIGLMYQDPEYDKYNFKDIAHVDCLNRLPICKAICCKFPFALSRQDVEEGIIRWDFAKPYLIAHDEDGYCVHLDRKSYQCTVREHRPVPCRGFDCRKTKKWQVWNDFENKILSPKIAGHFQKKNNALYENAINEIGMLNER